MSFSALLLPLRPYLTYYQYLAENNICSRALPLSGSSRRNRCKHTAGRAGKVPGHAHPSPHARGRAPLHTLAPNSSWIHLHPWISSGHLPPSLPGVPGRPRAAPAQALAHPPGPGLPGSALRPALLEAPAGMRSACSSASTPAQPGGATQGGTARSPWSHLRVARPPAPARPSRGAAQDCARAARGPRRPLGHTATLQDSRRQMACGGRLRGGWRRPSLLPFPLPLPGCGARSLRGAGRDLSGGCGSSARGFRGRWHRSPGSASSRGGAGPALERALYWRRSCGRGPGNF